MHLVWRNGRHPHQLGSASNGFSACGTLADLGEAAARVRKPSGSCDSQSPGLSPSPMWEPVARSARLAYCCAFAAAAPPGGASEQYQEATLGSLLPSCCAQ